MRKRKDDPVVKWLKEQGAEASITFDEETGAPLRTFTISLDKEAECKTKKSA